MSAVSVSAFEVVGDGTMDFVTNFADIDLDGIIYAVNCGQSHYSGVPDGLNDDPNAFNGGSWGTLENNATITVSGVDFIGDVINNGLTDPTGIARQLNKDRYWPNEPGSTDWWYIPITGQLIGGPYDSPDYIPGYTAESTGYDVDIAGRHFGPYESIHYNSLGTMFLNQGAEALLMRRMFITAGIQNLGEPPGQRDMMFHFDANGGTSYKLQLFFFTTQINESAMQILVEGDTYVTGLNVRGDILTAGYALDNTVLMYTCIVEAKDNDLDIVIRRDIDLAPVCIGMINAITVEPIYKAYNPDPEDGYEYIDPDLNVLGWTNPTPRNQGDTITVDVYIHATSDPGYDTGNFDSDAIQLLDNQPAESVTLSSVFYDLTAADPNDYYWRVDIRDPNGGSEVITKGDIWFFSTDGNIPPSVDAGGDQCKIEIPQSQADVDVQLAGTVTDTDMSPVSILWTTASQPAGSTVVFYDDTDPVTTVRLDTPGDYTLTLGADDGSWPLVSDSMSIHVSIDLPTVSAVVNAGSVDWLDELSDLDLSGDVVYAVNCGQAHYIGAVSGDPFNGGSWGSTNIDGYLPIDGVQFVADVINWDSSARQTNGNHYWADPADDWYYTPMIGQLYGGPQDSPDLLAGFDAECTGYDIDIVGQRYTPYESQYNDDTGSMFPCDYSAAATNLRKILAVSGDTDVGDYRGSRSAREMSFHFDADPDDTHKYKVQILLYAPGGDTGQRIDIESVTVLDKLNIAQCDAENAIIYTSDTVFVPAGGQIDIDIGRQTDNLGTREAQVAAIVITDLGAGTCDASAVDAGTVTDTYLTAGSIVINLNGSIADGDGYDSSLWTVLTANGANVQFDVAADPVTTATIAAAGDYAIRLTALDICFDPDLEFADTVDFTVYANACAHAQAQPGYTKSLADIDNDCNVDLNDLAQMAAGWMNCTATNDGCN